MPVSITHSHNILKDIVEKMVIVNEANSICQVYRLHMHDPTNIGKR